MNPRLQKLYTQLQADNSPKILNNETEIDLMIGKPVQGVTLQIDLSQEIKQVIKTIQQQLIQMESTLYLSPLEFAHISFNQVVYWKGTYKLGQIKTWELVQEEFVTKFLALNKTLRAFSIAFQPLIVFPTAIIWAAYDGNDELEKLRELFFEKLPFPTETPKRNHMIHTSLARFKKKLINPQKLMGFVSLQKFDATMKVSEIILRSENLYPSLKTREIARIQLI